MKRHLKLIVTIFSPAIILLIAGCASTSGLDEKAMLAQARKDTYQCHASPVEGMPETGNAKDNGCYFVLHSPETGKILSNAPYFLAVSDPKADPDADPAVLLTGVTDKMGRSVFVRTPFVIESKNVRFIQLIGSGEYKYGFTMVTRRGEAIEGEKYSLVVCDKAVYRSNSDYHGETAIYQSDSKCSASLSME